MNAPAPIAHTFAVADIAHAMGLHQTNVLRRAEKEGWPFEERTGRGGTKRLYPLNQLPADVRKAVQSKVMDKVLQDAGSFLPATAGGVLPLASPAVPFSLLTDAQRLERDARNGVRLAIERLQGESRCSLEAAIVTLLTNAGSGSLDSTLDAMLRLAKDKRGRKSDSPYLTKENITALFAVIGGLTGLMTFLWQVVDRRDRIHVKLGGTQPSFTPETTMYVINLSKHDVVIRDYGFVRKDGDLQSIPVLMEENWGRDDCPFFQSGDKELSSRQKLEAGVYMLLDVIGAYAVTATQSFPTVQITKGNWFQRLYSKARVKYVTWGS